MYISIVGQGIAGSTLALALLKQRKPILTVSKPESDLGFGLSLMPRALFELYELGVFTSPDQLPGVELRRSLIKTPQGQILLDRSLWSPKFKMFRQAFLRKALLGEICQAINTTINNSNADFLKVIGEVKAVTTHQNHAVLSVEDFSRNLEITKYDVSCVCGCDGIGSKIAENFFGPNEWIDSGFNIVRGLSLVEASDLKVPAHVVIGNEEERFVFYPIDRLEGKFLINWIYASASRPHDYSMSIIDWVVRGVRDWHFDISLDQIIGNVQQLWRGILYYRAPCEAWVIGNVCLLGDAAHPMAPMGSTGATQAIIDASCLSRHFDSYGFTAEEAFHQYWIARKLEVSKAIAYSSNGGLESVFYDQLCRCADFDWLSG